MVLPLRFFSFQLFFFRLHQEEKNEKEQQGPASGLSRRTTTESYVASNALARQPWLKKQWISVQQKKKKRGSATRKRISLFCSFRFLSCSLKGDSFWAEKEKGREAQLSRNGQHKRSEDAEKQTLRWKERGQLLRKKKKVNWYQGEKKTHKFNVGNYRLKKRASKGELFLKKKKGACMHICVTNSKRDNNNKKKKKRGQRKGERGRHTEILETVRAFFFFEEVDWHIIIVVLDYIRPPCDYSAEGSSLLYLTWEGTLCSESHYQRSTRVLEQFSSFRVVRFFFFQGWVIYGSILYDT